MNHLKRLRWGWGLATDISGTIGEGRDSVVITVLAHSISESYHFLMPYCFLQDGEKRLILPPENLTISTKPRISCHGINHPWLMKQI